ncbi:response regulator transcription factor [Solihabitans fulvus]|uniref:Response regulator transcription factor n=1 Tax=Solihabitans fulvus TaxID=1892852 RepID=A0A5B2XQP0_9PSEU|nr:response regulator transcription factor [Solihabitans fulvus]KAA2265743.1 response regulator transcription factor [Solihabitans fulvus]
MTTDRPRILVVEDDTDLSNLLGRLLTDEGYLVDRVHDGHTALHRVLTDHHDVLLVDRGLPAIDGLDLITRLRRRGVTTPALVLSARGTPGDRVQGLDAGAEDYLPKPFDIDELLARLRALRRRHLHDATVLPLPGGRLLDVHTRTVSGHATGDVTLSERECDLLALLAANPTQVFTRVTLRDSVFRDTNSDAAVETYVHYLRRKLDRRVIATVRGLGYRLGAR